MPFLPPLHGVGEEADAEARDRIHGCMERNGGVHRWSEIRERDTDERGSLLSADCQDCGWETVPADDAAKVMGMMQMYDRDDREMYG